jgi:hypothetical protein
MTTRRRRWLRLVGAGLAAGLAGCGGDAGGEAAERTPATPMAPVDDPSYSYTHLRPTGNRVLDGAGDVRTVDPVTVDVGFRPAWLLAHPGGDEGRSRWTVVGDDGAAATVAVADAEPTTVADHRPLPGGMPPLGRYAPTRVGLVRPPADAASRTHPVPIPGGWLVVAGNGDLVARTDAGTQRWAVDALRDGRIVHVDGSRYALLGDRTTRYGHGALGGTAEGGSLVVVDVDAGRLVARRTVGPPTVVEGVSPLVADVDGDGEPEVVVTVADADDGARIAVHDATGSHLATGPVYGSGWRHQLCVAPFPPDGRPELAVTRKPHVDRVVEFYRFADGDLTVEAEVPGVSTHTYGSHNVDGGLAADLDADGRPELLVPNARRDELLAIRRTAGGAAVAWRRALGGTLRTNLAGVALPDGGVAVGAGTAAGVRVWQG